MSISQSDGIYFDFKTRVIVDHSDIYSDAHGIVYIKGSNQLLCILVMLRMRNARAAMFMWICTQKLD